MLEKVVAEQLKSHFERENLLHPIQFGFRTHHSTETACCYFLEVIKARLDKGGVMGAVFLDLRTAFNTVSYSVLLSKLSNFKLSANIFTWLGSYLSGIFNVSKSRYLAFKTVTQECPRINTRSTLILYVHY